MRAAAAAVAELVVGGVDSRVMKCYLPAAAAGSAFVLGVPGLIGDLIGKGLRLRRESEVFDVGDRDRLSNREARLGSGSVWSNLDLLELFLSSSAILEIEVII